MGLIGIWASLRRQWRHYAYPQPRLTRMPPTSQLYVGAIDLVCTEGSWELPLPKKPRAPGATTAKTAKRRAAPPRTQDRAEQAQAAG